MSEELDTPDSKDAAAAPKKKRSSKKTATKKTAAKKTTTRKASPKVETGPDAPPAKPKAAETGPDAPEPKAKPAKPAEAKNGGSSDAKSDAKSDGNGKKSDGQEKGGGDKSNNSGNNNNGQQQRDPSHYSSSGKRRRRRKKKSHQQQPQSYQPDPEKEPVNLFELQELSQPDLVELAEDLDIEDPDGFRRNELLFEIMKAYAKALHPLRGRGVLERLPDNYGFLRNGDYNYLPCQDDIYVPPTSIRRHGLRNGDYVECELRPPKDSKEKFFAMMRIIKLNDCTLEETKRKIPFEQLTPLFPDRRAVMEVQSERDDMSMRVVDLVSPIGFGQRALIVAPPRTGKTVLMQKMANSISTNNPDARLIILLVDERPEEVTDMQRTTKAEVVSSTFDEHATRHVQVAEIVIEMAKRDVENGRDVVILLDSITRLARAYNTVAPHSGRIMTGGIDIKALHKPKRFFGAARNIEGGGSLTIIATALIDTGSKMDEVIFEEFKGTGNMELHLDRALVEKRVYPAINIEKSGTRKEENLTHPDELSKIWIMRRALKDVQPVESMELLIGRLKKTSSNAEFLMTLQG